MANKRNYAEIKELIDEAVEYRQRNYDDDWQRNKDWLEGRIATSSEINYKLNISHSVLEVLTTSVYSRDPRFTFEIHADLDEQIKEVVRQATISNVFPDGLEVDTELQIDKLERILEKIVKIYNEEMQSRKTNKRCVKDAGWAGFGCTKMGYVLDLDKNLKEMRNKNNPEYNRLAETLNLSDVIQKEEVFRVRVNPFDMYFPPDAPSIYEARWVCQVIYLDEKDANDLYGIRLPKTAATRLRYDTTVDFRDADKVKIYEFHSLDANDPYIYTLAEGYGKLVRVAIHPLYDDTNKTVKNLFQFLWFNDALNSPYPVADLSLVADQIREVNLAVTRRVELIKRQVAQFVAKGAWDDKELQKIKEAKDGDIAHIFTPDAQLEQVPLLTLGSEFYNNIREIRSEILEVLGLTDYSTGGSTQARKATEAQIIERSRLDRVQNRINSVDEFVFSQADTFVEIVKAFEVVRDMSIVLGPEDKLQFEFNGIFLDLADVQIQVVPGSTVMLDEDMELRRITQLAQIAQGFAGVANLEEIWKEIVVRSGFAGDAERFVAPPQPPIDIQGSLPGISGMTPQAGQPSETPLMQGVDAAALQGL